MSDEVKPEEVKVEEKLGVKELKEALIAAAALAVKLIKLSKDGLDLKDVAALMADQELQGFLGAAIDGASKIPAEAKDLDLLDGVELAEAIVPVLIQGLK